MRQLFCLALLVAGVVRPAAAHHSYAIFDSSKVVAVSGTVQKMEWVNPHAWLHVIVRDATGAETAWQFECRSTGELARQGLRSIDFRRGDQINVEYWPARDGSKVGSIVRGKTADGKLFGVTAAAARGGGSPFAAPSESRPGGNAP